MSADQLSRGVATASVADVEYQVQRLCALVVTSGPARRANISSDCRLQPERAQADSTINVEALGCRPSIKRR